MQKPNIFKIASIGTSVVLGIVAVLIFSGKFPGVDTVSSKDENGPALNVWGTLDRAYIEKAMLITSQSTGKPFQFNYEQHSKNEIAQMLTEADATGRAPDMLLAEAEVINAVSSLLYILPYSYMDELTYKNMYIDASHIYTTPFGVRLYPVLADPLITFYNKKIFRENGITNPPSNWLELPKYQNKLTIRDINSIPAQSAFGIGANNVVNNKNILVANLMQLGHNPSRPYYGLTQSGGLSQTFDNDLGTSGGGDGLEGDIYKMLRFQTAFSDPQKTVYTWSEVDVSDYEKFKSGRSAIYFGKASDYYKILAESPNIELGIDYLPQLNNKYNVTTGDLIGIAVSKSTKDLPHAIKMAQSIAGNIYGPNLSSMLGMSSARKDVLAGADGSARSSVVGGSAITMQLYYDVNFKNTDSLFYSLYDDILSGRKSIEKSVGLFERGFMSMYKK